METLKTIGVLVVLLVVGYLGYKAVTNPPVTPPNDPADGKEQSLADATNVNIPIPELPPGTDNKSDVSFAKTPSGTVASLGPSDPNASQVPTASLSAIAKSPPDQGGASLFGGRRLAPSTPPAQSTSALDVIPPQPAVGSSFNSPAFPGGATPSNTPPITETLNGTIATPGVGDPSGTGASPTEGNSATATGSGIRQEFAAFLEVAYQKLDRGEFAQVHQVLSAWYADPRLTAEEAAQLTDLLDQVAGTVVYSRQHILEAPYTVQPGETLPQIAQKYDVPWELLAKINGIVQPDQLSPGMQLKVVRGPFEAIVRLQRRELVLMVQGRYAGRFQIGIGRDAQGQEGVYQVSEKTLNPRYYSDQGVIEANDPRNPLGSKWLGLEGRLGIHAARDPSCFQDPQAPGAIFLTPRDMDDVFDILSIGSRVVITP